MDSGVTQMPAPSCLPVQVQTHIKNQGSNSSAMSHDGISIAEAVPSPRRWSPTYIPRRRSRQVPSLSFIPSPVMPRVESQDFSTSSTRRAADRGTACMSPFRSVRKMKEPFQLMLPSSPASLDGPPPAFPEKPSKLSTAPAEHTLRTWRSDQNLTSSSMDAFGLLPSPPMSESRPASTGPEISYFDSFSSQASERSKDETEEQEANDFTQSDGPVPKMTLNVAERATYTAYRPPNWENQSRPDVMNVHQAHSEFVRLCESGNEQGAPASKTDTPTPTAASPKSAHSERSLVPGSSPRPQRLRAGTVSSEASWVPSNFSYCERWLQGVPVDKASDQGTPAKEFNNRRKCQIVENDPPMPKLDIIPGAKALKKYVVHPKTKPKLVDIARQSSPSVPLVPPAVLLPQTVPTTPDQRQEEVSVFSPDTPLYISDSGYETRDSGCSFNGLDDTKSDEHDDDGDAYTDPGSLTSSDSVGSTVICERPDSVQGEREVCPQPEIRSGSVSPKASSPTTQAPDRTSTIPEKQEEKPRLWHHEWTLDDHEWTLDELDHSVKDFPRHMLRLTSPVMVFLRKNDEKALLRPFRTIFPDVTENLLDCLCAALLARNYLLSLSTIHRTKPSPSTRNESYPLEAIPTKAYSTLGIQLPSGSSSKTKDRIFGPRNAELRARLERIVDNLLFAICGRSDPTLKSAVEVLAQVLETNA
ncbi:hypothetical protein N7457_005655 [Penicillium paradoxum]|uniref:uncharacterized protein n=1 Tax=Penicillium paradoxum TaxID=176176 RepID=UPI00254938F0|nr:uncharacterized protein N7457_005655 [Penicillium paradoxum]KAJ5780495.1 hypothetical protein N7457_005655 [Penicillium paradoxum]